MHQKQAKLIQVRWMVALSIMTFLSTTAAAQGDGWAPDPAADKATANIVLTNRCDNCKITYSFNPTTCKLKRKVECPGQRCVTIPGLNNQTCRRTHTSEQGGVLVSSGSGPANMRRCNSGVCSGAITNCKISHLKPIVKPIVIPDVPVAGVATLEDDRGVTTLAHSVTWTGSEILYQVTNESSQAFIVRWPGTPLNDTFLGPESTLDLAVPSAGEPIASISQLVYESLEGEGEMAVEAVVYLSEESDAGEPDIQRDDRGDLDADER